MPKGGVWGAKMGAKMIPKQFNIEDDFKNEKMLFQTLLELFWADLDSILESSELENRAPIEPGS